MSSIEKRTAPAFGATGSARRRRATDLTSRLRLPLMAAPMSIASTPELVAACCAAGIVGCFPTHNAWRYGGLSAWLDRLNHQRTLHDANDGSQSAPYAVNINVSRRKPDALLAEELALCRRADVEIVVVNAGSPARVTRQVHDWGALVISDAVSVAQARAAIEADVDGLMLVCAGAGGLTGSLSPMSFIPHVRSMFDGLIQAAGGIASGAAIRAALALGADMACAGTRFIATAESGVDIGHKEMIAAAQPSDIVTTDRVCGIAANFLRPSLAAHGLDADALPPLDSSGRPTIAPEIAPWQMLWSAGHSVAGIDAVSSVADVVRNLADEFNAAG